MKPKNKFQSLTQKLFSTSRSRSSSSSFLISEIKKRKRFFKISSSLILIFSIIISGLYFNQNSVEGADLFPLTDSYQATPLTHQNNQSNYQTTAFDSGNYTGVATDDTSYVTTSAASASAFTCGTSTLERDGITYGTVVGADGKCWLDRNLGATRVATSYNDTQAYGWLYQWGRLTDGHQIRTSGTTTILSSSDTPGNGNFIKTSVSPNDWRSPQNNNLWQGVDGISNPCPTGFRLPTQTEWASLISSSGITNRNTAHSSSLKLTAGGFRYNPGDGSLYNLGSDGYYWSSSPGSSTAYYLSFDSGVASSSYNNNRAFGLSVRCLKNPTLPESSYASQLYSFNTSAYATPSSLDISLLAYATANAGNGITTKIWNNSSSQWETLSNLGNTDSSMPGTALTQSITSNIANYIDGTNKVKILVSSTNQSVSGNNAVLNTDYIKLSFSSAPSVTTNTISNITSITAEGNGNITNTNGENPERFIQWSTTSNSYNETNQCTANTGGTGTYSCQLSGLTPDTTYYYRAKATNAGGTSYGTELNFTTLPEETTIPDPDPVSIQEAYTNNYISIGTGTLDSTDEVTTNLNLTLTDTIGELTLPVNTTITNTDSGNINMSSFTISNVSTGTRSQVTTSRGAIEIGIPGARLTFSQPITISIDIDPVYNGEVLTIQSKSYNESTWTDEGTCTVTNGKCTFQTTHATTYTVNGDGSITGETTVNTSLPINATIALNCTDEVNLSSITGTGKSTLSSNNDITCNIKTNNSNGYKLEWQASNENLTNVNSDTINPYLPTTPSTPEAWNINQTTSAWGARLKSTSTDNNVALWGTVDDYTTGKWLNINNLTPFQIITRTTETTQLGSDQIIQFGAEVGSNKFQPSGSYSTDVIVTATTL